MSRITSIAFLLSIIFATSSWAQSTEFVFSPEGAEFSDPLAPGIQNGARGVDGPFDLDRDGMIEFLVAQHTGGGRVHVIENTGPDTWELVYTTALIDSSASQSNVRFATGADLDGDGNWEIVYIAGNGYNRDRNPLYAVGAYVWEHDGVVGSDNYGTLPATIGDYYAIDGFADVTLGRAQNMEASDVDGDGQMELLLASDGFSANDIMYVLSVSGTFETDGVGSGFEAWTIESRLGPRENGNLFGGGSPYEMVAADLNGDGNMDISYHAWNNYNFFNATVTGENTYVFADSSASDRFYKASPNDDVALFGGVAVDMDGDGNDEVYYTNLQKSSVSVLNYNDGDDVTKITADNVGFEVIDVADVGGIGSGGIATGDVDDDGVPEVFIGGPGYSARAANAGEGSRFISIAEYNGGDVMDPSSYFVELVDTSSPVDLDVFNTVISDSAGIVTQRLEAAHSNEGERFGVNREDTGDPIFTSGIVYLGDADGDGFVELATSFQGVDDTLMTLNEVYKADSLFGIFNTPDGAANPAPILPGESYSFSFDAEPGSFFTFATMFVESNDLFFAPADSGIALYNADGTMRTGDVSAEVKLWDAGTELNEEPFVGPNQAPRQAAPNTGEADTLGGVTPCCVDGFDYPAVSDVVSVTLDADAGSGLFTVTITNVSSDPAAVPLAPGVYAVGPAIASVFKSDSKASTGLEALAEDGDPTVLNGELLSDNVLVFFRTVTELRPASVRSFVRVYQMSGTPVHAEQDRIVLPSDYKLSSNYPNPFNPSTTFDFTLPVDKRISVRVYDVNGRLVTTLVDNELRNEGKHQVTWNGTGANGKAVASGTYMYTLEYGNFRQTRSMVLLK